uniref:Solute carrier family 40 protein n=1 Tax=Heterorhabditis bacteriophora TaxID=37862 RepID=A0A1I7XKB1_HETBA
MALILFQISVPQQATKEPTDGETLLLKPSRLLASVFGYLMGLADFTLTLARAVICQVAVPENRMEVFSLTRIYQCISSCIVLFLSPYMSVTYWTITLAVGLVVGSTTFIIVAVKKNSTADITSRIEELTNKDNDVVNNKCLSHTETSQ